MSWNEEARALRQEIERLRALNAELMAALEEIAGDPAGVSIVQAEIAKQALGCAKGEP